ncbi:MAG: SRPBCC domain-containing protein [Pseudooceanicola sp.]
MTNDLTFTRILPAPRDLVWACLTDPNYIPLWFMPHPHKALSAEIDLRPGGIFCVEMEVEGQVMKDPGVVLEAVPARRFVFTDTYAPGWKPKEDPFMTAIIDFADHPEGTEYKVTVRHRTPESARKHEEMGFFDGWGTVATQLGEAAQGLQGPDAARELTVTRHLDAAPALVWRAWTDPDLLPQWFGPDGYHCETREIDLRPGGHWRFDMIGEGQRFANLHEYGEFEPERSLAYRLSGFEDMRHHADVTVTLTPEGSGTRVTLKMVFADIKAADAIKFGALEKGYETLAKLEATARTLV